jgi:hypothetical protein
VAVAKQQPIYMYHGTSSRNLSSILSEGLVINPKEKVWETDPYASFHNPSRASIGGIYFTKNLMTAISSSTNAVKDKYNENRIIVIGEIKPGSLMADEDTLPSSISQIRMPDAVPNESISCYLWADINNEPISADLISAKNLYIQTCINRIEEILGNKLHENLKNRLIEIFDEGFIIALKRQVSHVDPYWYKNSIERVLGRDKKIEQPSKDDAEEEYSNYLNKITRTLRVLAISEISGKNVLRSGRIEHNIKYSGGNKIVGILKLPPPYDKSPYKNIKIIYEPVGGIPQEALDDFINQYTNSVTPDFIINK